MKSLYRVLKRQRPFIYLTSAKPSNTANKRNGNNTKNHDNFLRPYLQRASSTNVQNATYSAFNTNTSTTLETPHEYVPTHNSLTLPFTRFCTTTRATTITEIIK